MLTCALAVGCACRIIACRAGKRKAAQENGLHRLSSPAAPHRPPPGPAMPRLTTPCLPSLPSRNIPRPTISTTDLASPALPRPSPPRPTSLLRAMAFRDCLAAPQPALPIRGVPCPTSPALPNFAGPAPTQPSRTPPHLPRYAAFSAFISANRARRDSNSSTSAPTAAKGAANRRINHSSDCAACRPNSATCSESSGSLR